MLATHENLLLSSMLLWTDNRLLTQGLAYHTVTGQFYPLTQYYNDYQTFSASFKPICSDISVPGATIMTGAYVNNTLLYNGQSGMSIDYANGNIYLPNSFKVTSPISGIYSFNEICVTFASYSDITILFETKLSLRPKVPQVPTGMFNNQLTYPVIFLKNEIGHNEPFSFGGLKNTISEVNMYVFAESQFQLDAIVSNFKDAKDKYIPFLSASEMPFNNMGGFKNNIPYNYTGIVGNRVAAGNGIFISDVTITDWGRRGLASDIAKMTTEAFFSLATFTLERVRNTK